MKDSRWKIAGEVLRKLEELYGKHNVILAGGAIRDGLNDKPIKDFDFFVHAKPPAPKSTLTLKVLAGAFFFTETDGEGYDEDDFATWSSSAKTYQIMFVTCNPRKVVRDTFDINICKAWFSSKEGFVKTIDYTLGVDMEQIISDGRGPHLESVQAKYPDFNVEVLDETVCSVSS